MNYEFAQATHIGDRALNQDYAAHNFGKGWALFVVADGLGGHESGELASQGFCSALVENSAEYAQEIEKDPENGMKELINAAVKEMADRLLELGHADARTTAVIVWLTSKHIISAHIGDSRAYLLSDKQILRTTQDHSLMQQLLDSGQLSPQETLQHPSQTILLRSISCFEPPDPEIHRYDALQAGQLLLLCTDGFWQYSNEQEMMMLTKSENLQNSLNYLVANCVMRSQPNSDNVTVQVVRLK